MSYRQAQMEAQADFQAHEMGRESNAERRWSRWLAEAETLARMYPGFRYGPDISPKVSPLDGDEPSGDTFSLDGAYLAWERGESARHYVLSAHDRMGA